MNKKKVIYLICSSLLLYISILTACTTNLQSIDNPEKTDSLKEDVAEVNYEYQPGVLHPEATGSTVIGDDTVQVDISNSDQGYIMAIYKGVMNKAIVQVTGSDANDYQYYMTKSDSYVVIPLVLGNDSYQVVAYENTGGNQYTFLWTQTVDVQMKDPNLTFLYPNQYVNFNTDSKAVRKAEKLTKSAKDDLEMLEIIYNYVVDNVSYDDEKAENVESGYLPSVDETLKTGKGICFDYAALMVAMLRSRGIPSKLDIGYTGDIYHAWISTYLKEKGWVDNIIEFDGQNWRLMDPTFASSGKENNDSEMDEYITNENNYIIKYIH